MASRVPLTGRFRARRASLSSPPGSPCTSSTSRYSCDISDASSCSCSASSSLRCCWLGLVRSSSSALSCSALSSACEEAAGAFFGITRRRTPPGRTTEEEEEEEEEGEEDACFASSSFCSSCSSLLQLASSCVGAAAVLSPCSVCVSFSPPPPLVAAAAPSGDSKTGSGFSRICRNAFWYCLSSSSSCASSSWTSRSMSRSWRSGIAPPVLRPRPPSCSFSSSIGNPSTSSGSISGRPGGGLRLEEALAGAAAGFEEVAAGLGCEVPAETWSMSLASSCSRLP
mmetsp:Transcript_46909/g.110438  ORF Transcript_46909/g.110438 Transcript_46909/m.110438 type:complete len:283 (+) Transcript_46909:183-1031(+)